MSIESFYEYIGCEFLIFMIIEIAVFLGFTIYFCYLQLSSNQIIDEFY